MKNIIYIRTSHSRTILILKNDLRTNNKQEPLRRYYILLSFSVAWKVVSEALAISVRPLPRSLVYGVPFLGHFAPQSKAFPLAQARTSKCGGRRGVKEATRASRLGGSAHKFISVTGIAKLRGPSFYQHSHFPKATLI